MIDPFGTILSWTVIIGVLAYVLYHLAKIVRLRRLETRSGAAILFGNGLLVIELPRRVYAMPSEAFDALSWVGAVAILFSITLEVWDRRARMKPGHQQPREPA